MDGKPIRVHAWRLRKSHRMPRAQCTGCCSKPAALRRPKTGKAVCRECFYLQIETEVHETIQKTELFNRGEMVVLAVSGGKDSTVLAHIMKTLNDRYDYGLDLRLLAIDEGIRGYRDDSLETVKRNSEQYGLRLEILSYGELYGWTMDEVVREVGAKSNCTFCGVFRRQALDRGAMQIGADKLCTGHNADDIAETILMNIMRGDFARLERCVAISTEREGPIPRCKPFKYTYEKEIVMYAYFKKLDYFTTECIYSPNAYRGHVREYIKDLEILRPAGIISIIESAEAMVFPKSESESEAESKAKKPVQGTCLRCGYISSQSVCRACKLLEGLNKGVAKLAIKQDPEKDLEDAASTAKGSGGCSNTLCLRPCSQRTKGNFCSCTGAANAILTNNNTTNTTNDSEELLVPKARVASSTGPWKASAFREAAVDGENNVKRHPGARWSNVPIDF